MLTRQSLADALQGVNVAEVARRSGISEKTIYRLRHQTHAPGLDTVERLLKAVAEIEATAKPPRRRSTDQPAQEA